MGPNRICEFPFPSRPYLSKYGAAAAASGGNTNIGLKSVVAGGIAGGIEVCATYPTQYVKTQLQLDEKNGKKQYNGMIDCFKKTVRNHGFFALYRGLSVLLYTAIPKSAIRFGSFEQFKKMSVDAKGNLTPLQRMACGLGAGVTEAILVVTPQETIRVKFIDDQRSEKPKFKGFFHGVREIIKSQGIRGTYQGLGPTIARQGSNHAIRFFLMESLKDWYNEGDPTKTVPKLMVGTFGVVAGAAGVFANTPIDVVKTRMQGLEASKYKHSLDCIRKIWKEGGIKAMYKGTVPRLTRAVLDGAITFMTYDSLMEFFNNVWK